MSFIRFIGIVLICALFLLSGATKLTDPKGTAAMIKAGGLPKVLKLAQVPVTLTNDQYVLIAQATGGAMVTLAFFVVLGVLRSACAALLALLLIGITVLQHLNLENPAATPLNEQIHILKNLSIVGGLFVVASLRGGAAARSNGARAASPSPAAAANKKKQ